MNKRKIKAFSYGKINLSLNVSGKNREGYHLLDSVAASVNIADAVTVCERWDSEVNVFYNGEKSRYENDSVIKTLSVLRSRFGNFGADIAIEKRLPQGGGLGGSSADAAAVFVLLDNLYSFTQRGFEARSAALNVGSDVYYMMKGGYARMTGTGSDVEFLDCRAQLNVVLAKGGGSVSSKQCYEMYDEICGEGKTILSDNEKLISALKNDDFCGVQQQCGNALTQAAVRLNSEVGATLQAMTECGCKPFMTGSGSCCAAIFSSADEAAAAERKLRERRLWVHAGNTVKHGIEPI